MATGGRNQQIGRAGEHFVAAELNRRGAYAVTFAGNMPKIDILASDHDQTRTVTIQVKTRHAGSWQSSTDEGKRRKRNTGETHFWVFVDLINDDGPPTYYVVPEWWIKNDIYKNHQAYLKKHGGKRKINPDSKHHTIMLKRIKEWENRWDILKIS